jgi:glucose-1-phosphate adenylyltransferase
MLASGVLIIGGTVRHVILFPSVRIEEGAVIENAVLFQDVVVGEGARLQNCIIEKGVVVPAGETIGFDRDRDAQRFTVSERGIVVVARRDLA